jgi:LysR family transcriptional regulator, regulator for bpeEF and oprC
MTLDQLRVLVAVVQAGSFTRAAGVLATQKSHVSRVVAQLEAELGAKLLERSTRSLSVTETGREVFERAVAILDAADDTTRLVQQTQTEPQGLLRLTCGVEFGMLAVSRWVSDYLIAHPKASADVDYTSRVVDLVHEGFDLSIRVGPVAPSRLVARALGRIDYALFACPIYLQQHPEPLSPQALRDHGLVMFSGGAQRKGWLLQPQDGSERDAVRIEGPARLRVNNSFAVRDALLRSLGIGQLPLLIAADAVAAGRLLPVLPGWQPQPAPVHAVYPSSRYLSPKVRAFIDLALARFPSENEAARASLCSSLKLQPSSDR